MNQYHRLDETARGFGCAVLQKEPMRNHTSFKIGGPVDRFLEVTGSAALTGILRVCREERIPFLILGKGSNLLVPDEGLRGAVLHLCGRFEELRLSQEDPEVIECGCGVSLARLCKFAQANALSGLEFAWGIPGSAGGAAYMNAGAYGGEMKDVVQSCRHITREGRPGYLSGEALAFSYRQSAYSINGAVITGITLRLKKGNSGEIQVKMDDFMQRRKSKQPLEYPSAGSVFKRPEGYYAGGLIQQCGLKGKRIGGAMVSEKHAGFIINEKNATCDDVRALIAFIQETVKRETGVSLECEVKTVDANTLKFR